jgi:hypothetical protein
MDKNEMMDLMATCLDVQRQEEGSFSFPGEMGFCIHNLNKSLST